MTKKSLKPAAIPQVIRVEALEPRVLYSAESAPFLALVDPDREQSITEQAVDQSIWRSLTTNKVNSDSSSLSISDGVRAALDVIVPLVQYNEPVAVNDNYTILEGATLSDSVLVNDTDADGDPLTATIVTNPNNGSLTLLADGSFTYVHDGGTSTSDSFTYSISDGTGNSTTATAVITIEPVNDAPEFIAVAMLPSLSEQAAVGSIVGSVAVIDEENNPVFFALDSAGNNYFSIDSSGDISLTAPPNYESITNIDFVVRATDSEGSSNELLLNIIVTDANEAPEISFAVAPWVEEDSNGSPSATIGSLYSADFNDVDAGSSLSGIAVVGGAQSVDGDWVYSFDGINWIDMGSVSASNALVLAESTLVSFIPAPDFNGETTSLLVRALDNAYQGSYSSTGTPAYDDVSNASQFGSVGLVDVELGGNVNAVNDNPVAVNDAYTVVFGGSVAGKVTSNDYDVDGDTLQMSSVTTGLQNASTLDMAADGSFVYYHDGTSTATDWFDYQISDGNGGFAFATATINVVMSNTAPVINTVAIMPWIGEQTEIGTVVGSFTATDVENHPVTLTLVPKIPAYFELVAGEVKLISEIDYESTQSVGFSLIATDSLGASTESAYALLVADANDAPTIASASLAGISEDTVNPNGASVSNLYLSTFNDVDAGSSFSGIAITGNTQSQNGAWEFSNDGATWQPIGNVSVSAALVLSESDSVRFVPSSNYNGVPDSLLLRALDNGYAGAFSNTVGLVYVDVSSAGQFGSVSVADVQLQTAVNAVNDRPQIPAVFLPSIMEDNTSSNGSSISSLLDGSFSDVDAGDTLAGIVITNDLATAAQGTWEYASNGANWFSVGAVTSTNGLVLDKDTYLRFVPTENYSGTVGQLSVRGLDSSWSGGYTGAVNRIELDASVIPSDSAMSFGNPGISIEVTAVNDAPIAVGEVVTVVEGGSVSGNIFDNDSDAENDPFELSSVSITDWGWLDVLPDGSFTYTHYGDNTATDSFSYTLTDGTSNSASAVLQINVTPVNDAPVFNTVVVASSISEAAPIGTVVGEFNVTDEENHAISLTLTAPGSNYFSINASNELILIAQLDKETLGTIAFDLEAVDEFGLTTTVNVSIDVDDANEAPEINSASLADVSEDNTNPLGSTVSALFSASFSDVDVGADLSGIAITGNAETVDGAWQYSVDGVNWQSVGVVTPTNALVLAGNHNLRFLPGSNFFGPPAPLELRALDNGYTGLYSNISTPAYIDVSSASQFGAIGLSDAQLQTSVSPVNDAPVAVDDYYNVTSGVDLVGNVVVNDVDIENDVLNTVLINAPTAGTVTLDPNGSFTYVHDGSTTLFDTFTYTLVDTSGAASTATVDITITLPNTPPDFDSVTVLTSISEATPVGSIIGSVSVSDVNNDDVVLTVDSPGDNYFTIDSLNQIVLVAPIDYETLSSVAFNLRATDSTGLVHLYDLAISIDDVNEAPSIGSASLASSVEDTLNPSGATVASLYASTFSDVDQLSYLSAIAISGNTVSADGEWQYSNGGVSWEQIGIVSPQAALVVSESGFIRFLPATDFNGIPDPLQIRALDDGYAGSFSTSAIPVYIDVNGATHFGAISLNDVMLQTNISPVNDAPLALNDQFSIVEGETLVGNVSSNDSDIENDTLAVTQLTGPINGALTIGLAGEFTYVHNGGSSTSDSFVYQVWDGEDGYSTATVTIEIAPTNDAPVFEDVTVLPSISEQTAIGSVIGSVIVSDEENDTVVVSVDSPGDAYFTINERNEIVLIASVDHETLASLPLVLRVTDAHNLSETFSTNVAITNANEAPEISSARLTDILEDTLNPAGASISNLFTISFTDEDAGAVLAGVAVSGNFTGSNGEWQFSNDGLLWNSIGAVSPGAALVLKGSDFIRFQPETNYAGTPAPVLVHALDDGYTGEFTTSSPVYLDVSNAIEFGSISIDNVALETTVIPVNDAPQQLSAIGPLTVDENAVAGSSVGFVIAIDPDSTEFSYTLTSDASARFTIDPLSGEIILLSSNRLDFESNETHSITVLAHDNSDGAIEQEFQVLVGNVNESPNVAPSVVLPNVDEDQASIVGVSLSNLLQSVFTDPDAGDYLSAVVVVDNPNTNEGNWQYQVPNGTWQDVGLVSSTNALVLPAASQVRFNPAADYHGVPTGMAIYSLDNQYTGAVSDANSRVYLTDLRGQAQASLSAEHTVLGIQVNSINDSPTIQVNSIISDIVAPSDNAAPVVVADIVVSDIDAGSNKVTLAGPHAEFFRISGDGAHLQLKPGALLSVGDLAQLDVSVVVSDTSMANGAGISTEYSLLITTLNQPFVLSTVDTADLNFVENGAAMPISSALVIDGYTNALIDSARVTVLSGYDASQDRLLFSNVPGIQGQFDNVTGVLSFSGSVTASEYQAVMQSVTYINLSDNPTSAARVISMDVSNGEVTSNDMRRVINVVPVNDEQTLMVNSVVNVGLNSLVELTAAMLSSSDLDHNPSSLTYTKSAAWPDIELLVSSVPANVFTQHDIAMGRVELLFSGSEAGTLMLPLTVDDGLGEATEFALTVSVTGNPESVPPLGAATPEPVSYVLDSILSEVPPVTIENSMVFEPVTETLVPQTISDSQSTDNAATAVLANDASESSEEVTSGDQNSALASIDVEEFASNSSGLNIVDVANELSASETVVKKGIKLSAMQTAEMQLASLMSLEPITIETSGIYQSIENNAGLLGSIAKLQTDLQRASESLESNAAVRDTVVGFSLSITAGFLVWVLRGGALLASMFSISPLWKQLDPLPIVNGTNEVSSKENDDDSVEDLFAKQ